MIKRISNRPFDSVFVYSPDLDDGDFTIEKPFIYSSFASSMTVPRFYNVYEQPKFFLFRIYGGIDYVLSSSHEIDVMLYDFYNYSVDDAMPGANPVVSGISGGQYSIYLKEDFERTFLVRITPSYSSLDKSISITLSNPPAEISADAHFIRDWGNRIDGTRWGMSGKIHCFIRLSDAYEENA